MIRIKEAILHILDINTNEPIFSYAGLDTSERMMIEYIEAMVAKVEDSDSMKDGILEEDNQMTALIKMPWGIQAELLRQLYALCFV